MFLTIRYITLTIVDLYEREFDKIDECDKISIRRKITVQALGGAKKTNYIMKIIIGGSLWTRR